MSARFTGLIAAAVLGFAFLGIAILSISGEAIVVPTNGVTQGQADVPGGLEALPQLQERTRLQDWPGETAKRPSQAASRALGTQAATTVDGEQRVRAWLADRPAQGDILTASERLQGLASIPGEVRGVLEQPQGRTWRDWRNDKIAYGGALYVLGIGALLGLFLAARGRVPLQEPESGVAVERFSPFERANHWMTAGSFLVLAFTGLVILYGNAIIRPFLSALAYSSVAQASAWLHVAFAVPFVIGVLAMIVLWTRQNLPERLDWTWLKQGGGFLRNHGPNPPARRFNAGQKIVFWGVAIGGLALAVTGAWLMLPFYNLDYTGMQVLQATHAGIGLLMMGLILGHIYIGTIGMVGAFQAMWSGLVDRNWLREHHKLWYERLQDENAVSHRVRLGGAASFAIGAVIAIAAAFAAGYGYQAYSRSVAQVITTTNPSVHLDRQSLRMIPGREQVHPAIAEYPAAQ